MLPARHQHLGRCSSINHGSILPVVVPRQRGDSPVSALAGTLALGSRGRRVVNPRELRDTLRRRARRAGLDLGPDVLAAFERYYALLAKWNLKINLTAFSLEHDAEDHAIDRLLIEPVVASKHLSPNTVQAIDIGSGGGSPAIPMTIAVPRLQMRLVEAKTRKAVFLREAIRTLDLGRALVESARYEELLTRPDLHEAHDLITIRAVRVEPRTLMTLQAFLRPGGQIWLFRGSGGDDVVATLAPPIRWVATYPLIESLRSRLVVIEKTGGTRVGRASKSGIL